MRRLISHLRDLALLPAIWRQAVAAERAQRFRASLEGRAQRDREIDAILARMSKDQGRDEPVRQRPSGAEQSSVAA